MLNGQCSMANAQWPMRSRSQGSIRDASLRCRADQPHVLRKDATLALEWWRRPAGATRREVGVADVHAQLAGIGVDNDAVAIADERDRTTVLRFGCDVADYEPM